MELWVHLQLPHGRNMSIVDCKKPEKYSGFFYLLGIKFLCNNENVKYSNTRAIHIALRKCLYEWLFSNILNQVRYN